MFLSFGTRSTPQRAFTLQYTNITISKTIFLLENIREENITAVFSFNVDELTTFVDNAVCLIYNDYDLCIVYKTKYRLLINVNKRNEVSGNTIHWRRNDLRSAKKSKQADNTTTTE